MSGADPRSATDALVGFLVLLLLLRLRHRHCQVIHYLGFVPGHLIVRRPQKLILAIQQRLPDILLHPWIG